MQSCESIYPRHNPTEMINLLLVWTKDNASRIASSAWFLEYNQSMMGCWRADSSSDCLVPPYSLSQPLVLHVGVIWCWLHGVLWKILGSSSDCHKRRTVKAIKCFSEGEYVVLLVRSGCGSLLWPVWLCQWALVADCVCAEHHQHAVDGSCKGGWTRWWWRKINILLDLRRPDYLFNLGMSGTTNRLSIACRFK